MKEPPPPWKQEGFCKFYFALPVRRRIEDAALLKRILDAAEEVPTLKEELAWARSHGVKFFIDRTAVNVAGYYTRGTGVLGLCAGSAEKNFDSILSTLGHEIRHAWQDYHEFNKLPATNFANFFISEALVEADAYAYGERVRDEIKALKLAKDGKNIPADLRKSLADKPVDLKNKFLAWYANPRKLTFYGDAALRICTNKAFQDPAKKVEPPVRKYEFTTKSVPRPPSKLDITRAAGVLALGEDFSGSGNYFTKVPADMWMKRLIRPALAFVFWGAANDDQRQLAKEVRKENARTRLAEIRSKRKP